MTYPQPPGNWNDPSTPGGQPAGQQDPTPYPPPVSGQPMGQEAYPPSGYPPQETYPPYGYAPQPAYPPSGYPPQETYPPYGYPVMVAPPTNGMAIASMVVSIVGVLGLCGYGVGGYIGAVGAILGHVAKRQIRERGEGGDGMALAGIILGWIATAIAVIATIAIIGFIIWAANTDPSTFDSGN